MRAMTKANHFGVSTALAVIAAAAFVAVMMALFVLSPAVWAQTTITVTKTADTSDGNCTPSDCSLREAIIAANTDDNVVDVPAGTYTLTIPGSGEDDAATGDLDIRRGVTIRGAGARETIIDGNGIDRVFHTPIQGIPPTPFTVNISGVKITGGAIPDSVGGGILHTARGATLNLSESTVSGNRASQGGGIQNGGGQGFGETMTIKRSTISGNKSPNSQGGGILTTENLTLENTTVSGNKSDAGGGIMHHDGTLGITDSTIAFNTAQNNGGGIFINTTALPTIKNTIVSNNKSEFRKNCSGPVTSQGNNLEKGTTCGFTGSSDINADPKLGKLKDNGGPTDTRALLNGSPAIDAGGFPFPATDQRGVTRPQGAASDIGAYEEL